MNRLLLLLLVLSASQSFAQQSSYPLIKDVPAVENSALIRQSESQTLHNREVGRQLLGPKSAFAKNNDDTVQEIVHIQAGKTLEVCLDTSAIAGNFGSLIDLACSTVNFGVVTINDNCFSYTANTGTTIGRDTLCLDLCDNDNNCTSFIYPILVRQPLDLPFFEDFGSTYLNTDEDKWHDSHVFVNNSIGIDPPSVGVATFDGIDKNGRPYGGGEGRSDQLTSRFIDLSAFDATSNVYFSYWVEPKGYGDRPEPQDSLTLEFKDLSGEWTTVAKFEGIPVDTPSLKQFDFDRYAIQLSNANYFHDGFQFRFTNYSSNSGAVDNWHVDYVTIIDDSSPAASLEDISFTKVPQSILYEYSAMPWKHFEANPDLLRDSVNIGLFNHSTQVRNASSVPLFLQEAVSGDLLGIQPNLLPASQENLAASSISEFTNAIIGFSTYKTELLQRYVGMDSLIFMMPWGIDPSFEEAEQKTNNLVSRTTVFDDYMARDDGSAETNIVAQNRGTEIGVEYTAFAEDSLRAVAISFINIDQPTITQELFNLKIYFDSLQTDPVLENVLLRPILTNTLFDTIQSFTTYALIDPATDSKVALNITAGRKFYVVFQTASDNPIPIGFDRNSPEAADNNYLGISGGWFPFPQTHQGAVMIRPVFGAGPAITTSTRDNPVVDVLEVMQVYPNPSNGSLNFVTDDLRIESFRYQAFNTLGQMVQAGQLNDQVDFSGLSNGVYYLKLVQEGDRKIYNHKFILSK